MISFRRQEKKIMNQIVAYIPSILSVTNYANAIFIFYLVLSLYSDTLESELNPFQNPVRVPNRSSSKTIFPL